MTIDIDIDIDISILPLSEPPAGDLSIIDVTSSSVNVTVAETPDAQAYQLVITDPDGMEMTVDISPEDFVNGSFPYTFENLGPNTAYTIDLRVTNSNGTMTDGGTLMVMTGNLEERKKKEVFYKGP